jgi:hypothetical protein
MDTTIINKLKKIKEIMPVIIEVKNHSITTKDNLTAD